MTFNLQNVKIPHVFIFLSAIILFCAILTYIVPSGSYRRELKQIGQSQRSMVVPGSYQQMDKHYSLKAFVLGDNVEGKATPVSVLGLFTSIPKGMEQSGTLIFFVFIIGAVFSVIHQTGTVNIVMFKIMYVFRHRPFWLFLSIYFFLFAAASFLGMGMEFIPLIPLFLVVSKEAGYDRIFGIGLFLFPTLFGWTAALTNPFNVQIAQIIAEVPAGSGIGLRVVLFIVVFVISFIYLMMYGKKVNADKSKSLMYGDLFEIDNAPVLEDKPLLTRHIWILVVAFVLFALILFAVQTMGWGLIEMSGGFFMVGFLTILISGMKGEEAMKAFIKGLELMIVPALVVGFARGVQVVMTEGMIIDTLLHYTFVGLEQLPTSVAAEGMLLFQSMLNFFIPSASGQALVSMPIMVPLADLLGISRQTAVLAYVQGDGFSNIIVPTAGAMMAVLAIAKVPYEKWFRFVWPIVVFFTFLSMVMIYVALKIGY